MNINIGFLGIFTLIFVVFKILGYMTWSWLWVFCPLWIPFAFIAALWVVIFVGATFYVGILTILEFFSK